MGLWDPHKSLEDYLSPKERLSAFTPSLAGKEKLQHSSETIRPRNFTCLMFGKDTTECSLGAYSIFSIYRGKDRSEITAERVEVVGTIVEQAKRLIELLNAESYVVFDKEHSHPNQVKYPIRALQEAIVNAMVHRTYETDQPVRVTVFSDRIEILSPGSLPRGIDIEKFKIGKASAFWRNQTLAFFFNKLQLAQGEGQGIPTIIRTMEEEGCPKPVFEIGEESVLCILPAHPRFELMRELNKIENAIIIGNRDDALIKLESLLEQDPYNYRVLELYCEVNNLLNTQSKVYNFLKSIGVEINRINSSTLILLAETVRLAGHKDALTMGNDLMAKAMTGKLEEIDIRKIAIYYRRTVSNEKAIEFIDEAMQRLPKLAENASLLQLRGKSKIDLAKRCIDTARNHNTSLKMKGKAWDQCRAYLSDAENDLNKALDNATNETEKDYIYRDLEFLSTMQQIATKPPKRYYPPGMRN